MARKHSFSREEELMGSFKGFGNSEEELEKIDVEELPLEVKQQIVYINDENIPYFLCAFNERSGKNRTNYSTYTTVMKERINYFLGDDNYE